MIDHLGWTYGVEHELADWDQRRGLPKGEGWGTDRKDVTMVNSNGIAVDPKGKLYPYGGEVLTPPTELVQQQADHLKTFTRMHPEAKVNYRSNLHVHVRVPGLVDDLESLKRIARFNRQWLREVLPLVEPIPRPWPDDRGTQAEKDGAMRRYRRRRASHHTIVTDPRVEVQLAAETVEAFFEAECPRAKSDGRPLWHLAPRAAVNLRHLREDVDTVEFRHFPGTLDPDRLVTCVRWCRDYMQLALGLSHGSPIDVYYQRYGNQPWPHFPEYDHGLEVVYRSTIHDGSVSVVERKRVIDSIDPNWEGPK